MRKASFLLSLLALLSACASHPWGAQYDALAKQPGAKVTLTKDTDGKDVRVIALRGGVVIRQVREGKNISTIEEDRSGHGAVVCARETLVQLRGLLEACAAPRDEVLMENMDDAIGRINDFIVTNSATAVTKDALAYDTQQRINLVKSGIVARTKGGWCHGAEELKWLKTARAMSAEKIEHSVDDLLSVPRLPVLNPCH